MKLSKFVVIGSLVLVSMVLGLVGYNSLVGYRIEQRTQTLFADSINSNRMTRDLDEVMRLLQLDVVQTQQWITDISATRALDGLDDGLAEAQAYAERFPRNLSAAREIASELDLPGLVSALAELEAAYPPFYAKGKEMAQAYIEGGPELGNPHMSEFDEVAAAMSAAIEEMLAQGEVAFEQRSEHLGAEQMELAEISSFRNTVSLLSGFIIVLAIIGMAAFVVYFMLRKLTRLTGEFASLAGGNLETVLTESSYWEEFAQLSAAIHSFRDGAAEIAKMNADEHARNETTRARAEAMAGLVSSLGAAVDAALVGDFSQRVSVEHADKDLNGVAGGVNNLLDTVERGLAESGSVLEALANTDLTQRICGDYEGAFGRLKDDTNAVGDKLADVMGQLRDTSVALKVATGEILAGANDLSERTTKQAATVEETSATMEQLSSTVLDNARMAEEVSANAAEVAKAAGEGGEIMDKANMAMERITSS
ncbi:MAG TPA: methyl-accepting chemotaxis protein, partial [Devosia sp.]|nr:methyl-accepting chemotaxis protein [Devosia sp.]